MTQGAATNSEAVIKTILFTDLVGSTNRKHRLGDTAGALIIAKHDTLFRILLERHGGMEVDTAGDGFFSLFDESWKAILCALDFQSEIRKLDVPERLPARVGINTGSVTPLPGGGTGGTRDKFVGIAIDLAYRIMGLAEGGQILMTQPPFDEARNRALTGPLGEEIEWRAHGAYLVKGFDDPVDIFEAGIDGIAPLKAPAGGEDARRNVAFADEITLGWRPAAGIEIPGKQGWSIEQCIGHGGFGEVWTARSRELREVRAFKFCFHADRLRWLKREFTLLRRIKEQLGEREDIARLYDVRLQAPPFYIETQYSPSGDLAKWAAKWGGIDKIPFEIRLQLAAETADALAAAHSVGVIHKDVKPGNILIEETRSGSIHARLTDFGIGTLVSGDALRGGPGSGFTLGGTAGTDRAGGSGTAVYMAPELMAGGEATRQSDIYALGVLLFQFAVGNLELPLGMGWEVLVPDELLREDIAACLHGNPENRLLSVADLAVRLRDLEARRARREDDARLRLQIERSRRLLRTFGFASGLILSLFLAAGVIILRERARTRTEEQLTAETKAALDRAREATKKAEYEEYVAKIQFAASAIHENRLRVAEATLLDTPEDQRHWDWGYLMRMVHPEWVTLTGHTGALNGAWFSPDGASVLTVSDDLTARIWNTETGRELAVLSGHTGRVFDGSFSPDGTRIVTASKDGTARIWKIDGQPLFQLLHGECVNKARWSPDGTRIVTASDDGTAVIWDASSGVQIHYLRNHRDRVFDAKFSPTGKRVVTGCDDRMVRIWNSDTGALEHTLIGHHAAITAAEFSPDENYVLSCADEAPVILWDARTGEQLFSTEESHRKIARVAKFSKDGLRFATAGDDGTIMVWIFESRNKCKKLLHIDKRHNYEIQDVAFSPTGGQIVSAGKDNIMGFFSQMVSPDNPEFSTTIYAGHEDYVKTVEISPDGAVALSSSSDKTAKLWRLNTPPIRFGGRNGAPDAAFSADGKYFAAPFAVPSDRFHGARTGAGRAKIEDAPETLRSVALNSDGTFMAEGTDNGEILLFETQSDRWLRSIKLHKSEVRSLQFLPGGNELLSASIDGKVIISDVSEPLRKSRSFIGHAGKVVRAALSPDGTRVVSAGDDSVIIWDAATTQLMVRFNEHSPGLPTSACFSPDGTRILSTAYGTPPMMWNAETGKLIFSLKGHEDRGVWDGSFSPDGTRIATGGEDKTVKIWDATNGRELFTIADHSEPVGAVRFSPDGRRLASVTNSGGIILRNSIPWPELHRIAERGLSIRDALIEWERQDYEADREEMKAFQMKKP